MTVRTRFAPNPSGELHVGGAHTALFAWLFARHHGGTFVLRVEDTDPDRARPELIEPIMDALRWLGLTWDEGPDVGGPFGPYRQSERLHLYREAVRRLERVGAVYRCYCTREEVRARGTTTGYDRHCRTLPGAERARYEREGRPYALRFAVPEGRDVVFHDLIRGEVRVEYEALEDFVVVRSDGSPLYRLASGYDDILMEITHVIRGADLLPATAGQVLLFEALGARPPAFAHVPLILAPDRSKLSKRHGADSVQSLRAEGFLPEAVVNYLALLGWSSPSQQELLPLERIVREFAIERVNPSPSIFDHRKLEWMNQQYLQRLGGEEFERRVLEVCPDVPREVLHRVVELGLVQTRVVKLAQVREAVRYLHERPPVDPGARPVLERPEAPRTLELAAERLGALQPWTVEGIRDTLLGLVEELGLSRRTGLQPLYVAISGRPAALPLFESVWILGREEAVARIRAALGG